MTAHATKAPPLAFTPPCLAIARAQPPTGSNWVHEFKCDGYRVRALIDASGVRLLTRNAFDWTPRFGAVIEDFAGYRFFERPYFVAPSDALAGEGYVVTRDALAKTGKIGLAQMTISGREWLVAIAPLGDGLVIEMLRYAEELCDPADFFTEVPKAKPQ